MMLKHYVTEVNFYGVTCMPSMYAVVSAVNSLHIVVSPVDGLPVHVVVFAVDGLHDFVKHGSRLDRVSNRGCDQQSLRIGKTRLTNTKLATNSRPQ